MCGIFGVVPAAALKPQQLQRVNRLFTTLTVLSTSRGQDAAGGALVQRGGDMAMFKRDVPGHTIVRDTVWHQLLGRADQETTMWMGHTRAATCGPNTSPNAHPFEFSHALYGRLLGSHNGMLWNYHSFDGITNTDVHPVDSACLFAWLSKHQQSEWGEKLSKVGGFYALAMYREGRIHFARNAGAPLMLAYIPILSSWVYASTSTILTGALKHCGLGWKVMNELPVNRIYSIPEGVNGKLEIQVIPEYTGTETPWWECVYGR